MNAHPAITTLMVTTLLTLASFHADATGNSVTSRPFGKTPEGAIVTLYTLSNSVGASAGIMDYGGTVVSLTMPDRNGIFTDVVLGFDTFEEYLASSPYYGALIGRVGNRIGDARFTLDGKEYVLAKNFGSHHLHGGVKGFDKRIWSATPSHDAHGASLALAYTSPDGEENYPGTLAVKAVYTLTDQNELKLEFTATTDKPTLCNLTHHSYFNLAGSGEVLDHRIMIPAPTFTGFSPDLIPTGALLPVAGTPLDLQQPTPIRSVIDSSHELIRLAHGFDHNWVFAKHPGELTLMARVEDPLSGRILETFSTEPGLQLYVCNMDSDTKGKAGRVHRGRSALCLEPQHFPDSPHHPGFPSIMLRPGETYRNTILYRFSHRPPGEPVMR